MGNSDEQHPARSNGNTPGSGASFLASGATAGRGRYVLERELGQGGMGVVWLALDTELDERVALKFVPPEIRRDADALDELRRETQKSRRLTHPNILRIHDFFRCEGEAPFICMEYVEGTTLSALKAEQPDRVFAWEWLKPMITQLCQALDYAHRECVVHRDLKPANMMVDARGRLRLADFGLAASISDSLNRVSIDRGVSGTPAYMSPQQMDGRPPQATDDIYALGATLYELLTSKPPFHSGDVLHQARNFTPDSIAQRQTEFGITNPVPADVSALIMACLAKDAAQRPQSAGAVAEFVGLETASEPIGLTTMAVGSESREPYACASEPAIEAGTEGNEASPASGTKVGGTPRWLWVGFTAGAVVLAVVTTVVLIRGRGKDKNAVTQLQSPSLAGKSSAAARPVAFDFATKGQPFVNTLGMKFVPVPIPFSPVDGQPVLFCVWHTRVQDFEAFVTATGYGAAEGVWSFGSNGWKQHGHMWRSPGFEQTGLHPVSGINWEDARAFANWLTAKERAEGKLAATQRYRLPQDWEWSVAVGLNEARAGTPKDKDQKIKDVFPWGTQWPPPSGAGNYGNFIPGFRDGFERTSPVGSFAPNKFGLYDLGGNLWQWCEDWHDSEQVDRTLRGGSWGNHSADTLWSSYRHHIPPNRRYTSNGFRVVLATEPSANTNLAMVGYEIVGLYHIAFREIVVRTVEKAPVKQGDRIRVTGTGIYDGDWTLLFAWPYKSPQDLKPLWGYKFEAQWKGLPQGFDAKGGVPVPNAARLQPLPAPGGPTQATPVPTVSAPAKFSGKETNATALKYESLWNGKDLSNWQGDAQSWSVKDGLLIGRKSSPGKALLTWAGGPIDDFELVLIYRTQGDGVAYLGYRFDENAGKTSEICGFGVYANDLISRSQSAQGVVTNIIPAGEFFYFWKSTSEGVGIGRFGRLPEQLQQLRQRLANGEVLPTDRPTTASPVSDKSDGWQELVVSAKGDRLTHWVNGRLSAAIKLGAPTTTRAVAVDSGSIKLEYSAGWGKPFVIQFKEIRLTRLR